MALTFYAMVLNPGDEKPSCKVLRSMSLRGCRTELKRSYLKAGGEAVIYDGNPLNAMHDAKQVGTHRA